MGRVSRGEQCSVEGCENRAEHSLSYDEARILETKGYKLRVQHNRVYLCKEHYKELKKLRKKTDKLEKWRRMG